MGSSISGWCLRNIFISLPLRTLTEIPLNVPPPFTTLSEWVVPLERVSLYFHTLPFVVLWHTPRSTGSTWQMGTSANKLGPRTEAETRTEWVGSIHVNGEKMFVSGNGGHLKCLIVQIIIHLKQQQQQLKWTRSSWTRIYGTLYWMDERVLLVRTVYLREEIVGDSQRLFLGKAIRFAHRNNVYSSSTHPPSCFLSLGYWAKILKEDMVSQWFGQKMMKTMILMMKTMIIMETLENKWKKLILNTGQYCILRGWCSLYVL